MGLYNLSLRKASEGGFWGAQRGDFKGFSDTREKWKGGTESKDSGLKQNSQLILASRPEPFIG